MRPAEIGRIVDGKYELLRLVGVGGNGSVYEARHQITHRRVALKLLHGSTPRGTSAQERFVREVRAASAIDHPGVPEVFDAGIDPDDTPYIVMELLEGKDLAARLQEGISPEVLIRWMIGVLEVLSAAHAKGFIHRDIKPANIFIEWTASGGEAIKLMDFGVVRGERPSWHGLTVDGTIIGTPAYMSPEQALSTEVRAPADLWSIGAVMFHALTGRPPIEGSAPMEILAKLVRGEVSSIRSAAPGLPESLVAIVERALQTDPRARWGTADEMRRALELVRESVVESQLIEEGPTEKGQVPELPILATRVERIDHTRSRSWSIVLLAAAFLMVLLGIAVSGAESEVVEVDATKAEEPSVREPQTVEAHLPREVRQPVDVPAPVEIEAQLPVTEGAPLSTIEKTPKGKTGVTPRRMKQQGETRRKTPSKTDQLYRTYDEARP